MANRPSAKQSMTINRSNQEIALELSKAALAGGALTNAFPSHSSEKFAERARKEAAYIVALYKYTVKRLEQLEALER